MSELRLPFAVDEKEQLCSPSTAKKGGIYFCPFCRESIIVRQGAVRVPHFAHKVSDICSQESIVHKTAKMRIQKVVQGWKSGGSSRPKLQRACRVCGTYTNQLLPDKVDGAIQEYRLTDGSIVDVALMAGEMVQAAVEIKVTHAIDEIKVIRLSVPFIELNGYEIIKNPFVWKSIADNFKPITCEKCKSAYLRFQTRAKQIANASGIKLMARYYRYGLCTCWKCKREIIVLAWPKDRMFDKSNPKIKTLPKTVQYRFSKTVGHKYWVNTCPYCQSIQGDFFLYCEPDGPFFGVNIEEDSPAAFDRDMMKIAVYAVTKY